ncbi:MAG TPA: hypothetical protein VGX25_28720 [Actinophytocola sp.]|uniref:hypothetical protein n=1 Tax=Actinophytocola sp. TaxID=1872138 RepID=UPI002DDD192A|nr:hypothetical protein [Actinophytocola sp.]HEV2783386.1 hypothetical protein [Actinophytocola sp.]
MSPSDPAGREPVTEPADLPAKKITTRTVVIAAAIAILVLGAVGAGIYFLTGDDSPTSAGSGATGAGSTSAAPTTGTGTGPVSTAPQPDPGSADAGSVKAVAEQAVKAINARDPETLKQISCDPEAVGAVEATPPEARVELAAEPELTGDTATVELKLIIGDQSTVTPLPLRKQDGTWCVD